MLILKGLARGLTRALNAFAPTAAAGGRIPRGATEVFIVSCLFLFTHFLRIRQIVCVFPNRLRRSQDGGFGSSEMRSCLSCDLREAEGWAGLKAASTLGESEGAGVATEPVALSLEEEERFIEQEPLDGTEYVALHPEWRVGAIVRIVEVERCLPRLD